MLIAEISMVKFYLIVVTLHIKWSSVPLFTLSDPSWKPFCVLKMILFAYYTFHSHVYAYLGS